MPSLGRHTQELRYAAHRFYVCVCVCQLVELLEYALDDSAVFSDHDLLSSLPTPKDNVSTF